MRDLGRIGAAMLAAAVALSAGEAAAHRLRVFATVEGGAVSGYGFFAGGGRAGGARVTATDVAGATIHAGEADAEGAFAFAPPAGGPVTVTLEAGDGHRAAITLEAERFGGASPAAASTDRGASVPAQADAPAQQRADVDPAALAALVEAAVARQVRPLLEAQAQAEARIRFADVAGGVGAIVGMAGAALWAMGRRGG